MKKITLELTPYQLGYLTGILDSFFRQNPHELSVKLILDRLKYLAEEMYTQDKCGDYSCLKNENQNE